MRGPCRTIFLAAILLAFMEGLADAQVGRGYVVLGGGYLATPNDFEDGAAKRINAEDGRYDTSYNVKGGPGFEAAAGVTVWKRLGVRGGVGRFSTTADGTFEASIPHPFFFNKPRGISASVPGLQREELALNVHLAGLVPLGPRAHATIFGGPSWIQVKQTMVTDFSYTDAYPYDTAAFGVATTTARSGSKVAIGGGAALGYFLTKAIGLEGNVQFVQAKVPLSGAGGTSRTVKAGGFKGGVGFVARF